MTAKNHGFATLFKHDDGASPCRTTVILGLPRGGTTLAAGLVKAAGIYIGNNLPVTNEDPEFAQLLQPERVDSADFQRLVDQRNMQHPKWGFKFPYRNHWSLLASIPNSAFVFVFRDTFAVVNRNRISVNADLFQSMLANIALQRSIVDFVFSVRRPTFLFSYEKCITDPEPICKGLANFVGSNTPSSVAAMIAMVKPNDPRYLAVHAPGGPMYRGVLDAVSADRVIGWASSINRIPVEVEVCSEHNVIGSGIADLARQDLAARFGEGVAFGFTISIDTRTLARGRHEIFIRPAGLNIVLSRKTLAIDR
jgi:hypothetical protein